jgi:hypothetical protein
MHACGVLKNVCCMQHGFMGPSTGVIHSGVQKAGLEAPLKQALLLSCSAGAGRYWGTPMNEHRFGFQQVVSEAIESSMCCS